MPLLALGQAAKKPNILWIVGENSNILWIVGENFFLDLAYYG